MSTFLVREIQRRINALGTNPTAVSRKAGLNDTAVRDIIEGKSKSPKTATVGKIAKALGCTTADLLGERVSAPAARRARGDVVEIPELDVHVMAGLGGADDGNTIMAAHEAAAIVGMHTFPVESFREAYGVDPGRIRLVPVRGNSMEPELWSGQRAMVDIQDKSPSPPGIFVVWDGLGLVLKYVEVIPNSDPLRVRISSAHQAFQPYERTLDEAHINGRVIGVWKRL